MSPADDQVDIRKITELRDEVNDGTYQGHKKATFKEFAARSEYTLYLRADRARFGQNDARCLRAITEGGY
jgi:hypothetical protein